VPFKPPTGKPPPNAPFAAAPFPPPPAAKAPAKTADQAYIKKVKKLALIGGGALALLLVLGLGGLWAYNKFLKPEPPPKATPPAPKPQDTPAQTAEAKPADTGAAPADAKPADVAATDKPVDAATSPGPTTDPAAPQSAAGQAVAKARDAAANVEQGRTADANEVIASDSSAPKPNEAKPAVTTEPEQKPAVAETKPAVTAPKPGTAGPAPSQAFKAWVADLKNVSVRSGASARVFIGGITYPQGEVVNPQLGIVFEGYDDKRKMIIFRDRSGAKVERRR